MTIENDPLNSEFVGRLGKKLNGRNRRCLVEAYVDTGIHRQRVVTFLFDGFELITPFSTRLDVIPRYPGSKS